MIDLVTLLLIVAVSLMVVLVLLSVVVLRRLGRLQKQLGSSQVAHRESHQPVQEVGSGSAFDEFLNEDPKRQTLTKSEQFAEFRKWRKEKGMNWSG